MANPMQAGPLFSGASDLIGALTGGAGVQEAARQKEQMRLLAGQTAEAELDKKFTDAHSARDERKSRLGWAATLRTLGIDPAMADALGEAGMAGYGKTLADQQAFRLRYDAEKSMLASGNFDPANAALAALKGDPTPTVTAVGGELVTGNYGSNTLFRSSPKTMSEVLENEASAAASIARVGASNAQEYRTLNPVWNPNTGGGTGGKTYAPPAFTDPTAQAQAEVFGTMYEAKGTDEEKIVTDKIQAERFRIWRKGKIDKGDTRFNNGAFAINEWANQHDINQIAVKALKKAERGTPWTERNKKEFFRAHDRTTARRAQNPNPQGNAPGVIEPKPVTGERRIVNPKTGEVRVLRNNQWVAP